MNDPHVESLTYRFTVLDKRHDYSGALGWQGELGDFQVRLEDDALVATPTAHFVSEIHARAALEPLLRSWELRADLEDSIRIGFVFETSKMMDRQPSSDHKVVQIGTASEISIASHLEVRLGHASFPQPAHTSLTQNAFVRDLLTSIHEIRSGEQRLLVGAYLFLTRLEYEFGGSRPAAANGVAVSEVVLRKLGELSVVNDPSQRRKVKGPERQLTEAEGKWLDETLRRIAMQAAQIAAGGTPPQLTIADLPAI